MHFEILHLHINPNFEKKNTKNHKIHGFYLNAHFLSKLINCFKQRLFCSSFVQV